MFLRALIFIFLIFTSSGCDRLYSYLHKPSYEERQILGEVVFNEYNQKVEGVQKILILFGYNIGRPDGKFGASCREAVAKFQAAEGLEVTRLVDKATWARIEAYTPSPLVKNFEINVLELQKQLQRAGFGVGKPDGRLGPQTHDALRQFQRANNLKADGLMGLKTLKALVALDVPKAP